MARLNAARLRMGLMEKYGDDWLESPEWKPYKATEGITPKTLQASLVK